MSPANPSDSLIYFLFGIIVVLFLLFLLIGLVVFFKNFSLELQYINTEIRRSWGSEKKYWIKQRRRLLLSILPFVKY